MSQDSEGQSMYGWLICRFDRKQIHSILYGQFSKQQLPPSTGWVFLAKDAAHDPKESDITKLSKEGPDGKGLSLFAKGVDPDDLAGCINSVTGSVEDGISVNAAFLQNDKEPGAPTTRYYVLRNCPIPAVNGRYMEGGFHEGAPLYRNVREWALVRTKLAEMPELGISAKGSYAIQEGSSISEIYHEAAAEAYEELLSSSSIKDGSYDFKKRFIALSRAGNRMVTSDQSMQLDFVNQKRAALRTKLSDSLLLSLQAVRLGTAPAEAARTTTDEDPALARTTTTYATTIDRTADNKPPTHAGTASRPQEASPISISTQPLSRSNVPAYMNETLESCAPDTIKTASSSSPLGKSKTLPLPHTGTGQHSEEHSNRSENTGAVTEAEAEADSSEVGVEIDITLGRSISYQKGSQGFALNRLVDPDPDDVAGAGTGTGTGAFEDQHYLDAESELAREVTICIEEREAAVAALKMEAAMLARDFARGEEEVAGLSQFNQSVYGSALGNSGFNTAHSNFASAQNTARLNASGDSYSPTSRSSRPRSADYYLQRVEPLLEKMRDVRKLTTAFADAFGAWTRLLHKQKAAKWRREKKKAEQFGGSFKKMSRSYVVAIAKRSSQELYALSQAVNSSVKKFSRDMEPVKYATEIKLVGVYDTKDEAIAAFDQAFGEIPQEYMLLADIKAVNKKQIGLRRCGQHYIVRSSGVPQDMECEQCALIKQQQAKAASAVPELYQEEPVSQYIWNGSNYLEKMWTDLDFLADVEYLKRALPGENFQANPLLLSNESVQELLHAMHVHKRAGKSIAVAAKTAAIGSSSSKVASAEPRHPLNGLRGRQEQLRDAGRAGDRHNADLKQQAHERKYRDDPYNNTTFFGSIKDRIAARDASAEGKTGIAADSQEQLLQRANSEFLFSPSSVFYETTVGSLGSDFGQPVEVHEVLRSKYQNSAFSSRGGNGSPHSAMGAADGLETSMLTASMRASQSAPVLHSKHTSQAGIKEQTGSQSNKNASLSATAAGNGAAGVKGIKSAGSAKLRDKYTSSASPYAPTVTDLVPLPVVPKRARLPPHAENAALLSTTGLDLNKYLNDELRASSTAVGAPARSSGGFAGAAPRSTNQYASRWDEDFLQDSDAHRERLARALQVIGQCPVPANAIRSSSPTSASATTVSLHAGLSSGNFSASGPDAFSATVQPASGCGGGAGQTHALNHSGQALAANSTKEEKMTLVESFYAYRGAQMSIVQERRAVAHRTEETFCRSDVGEWKGFTKGRAMRAFEFQENLYHTGKKLEEDRMNLQQLIRAAVAVDIINCDVPYIKDLILQAEKMRGGSMLALDIAQAEVFLRQYRAVCKYALRGQCWFRGQRDRHRVREMRRIIRETKKHHRTTEIEVAKLAPLLVADLLEKCVQVQVGREKRSVFRFTMNMTGVLCMVSLRRQTAPFRKPVAAAALCAGCSTKCIITKFEPADRSYSKDRAPCTCVFVSPQEEWQLNIYNPLNRESFQHTVSVTQARQMLRGIESASKYMRTSQYAYDSLRGPSFGNLTPLFGPPPEHTRSDDAHRQVVNTPLEHDEAFSGRRLDRSFSMALLNAAAESAVLPRLPHLLPDNISLLINSTGIHHHKPSVYSRTTSTVPARRVAGFNRLPMLDGCKASEVLSDQDGPFDPQWDWRPLYDMNILRKEITRNMLLSEDFKQAAILAEREMLRCAESRFCAYEDIERANMVYEDARGLVVRVQVDIDIAARRIEEVMRFGKQLESEMLLEERGELVNKHQSHDQFESASGWVGLNQKRKLEKLHAELFHDCESKFKAFLNISTSYEAACATYRGAQERYETTLARYVGHRPVIEQRRVMLREMQVQVRAAANALLMTYSLPRKHASVLVPQRPGELLTEGIQLRVAKYTKSRRLQRIPWNLIFVRDPLERLRMENRAPLTVLQRRVMKLVPQQRTLDKRIKGHLRCVVLVLLDEVTGLIVLHIGQSEAIVEESNQHTDLDLHKSDFSDLTSHGLENDIILRPEDVDWLLSIPVEMSSENLRRANKYAKGRIQGYVPDPNKLHKTAEQPGALRTPQLVLPSQALRSLSGVVAHPVIGHKLRGMKPTYQERRDEKERYQVQRADQLLRYLRLQAHTGRPCVGLLHFRRRLAYSHQHINASSWLSDLVNADPLILINHVSSKTFLLHDDIVMVHMYSNMRRFNVDLQLPFPVHPSTVNAEVSVQQVIAGLQPQPLLLASFLWEFVTNSFSPQSLVRVFQDIDWELPGQLSRSYWRRPSPDEIPRPHFLTTEEAKYRGPIYQRHRFVSSRYFLAKLYLSVHGDMRIALMPPEDGKFHHHQYSGETLHVDISRAELCVVVAKLSVNANLVPLDMFGTVLLLHHHNVHLLFSILLEMVHLTLHHHSPGETTKHHQHHGRHVHGKACSRKHNKVVNSRHLHSGKASTNHGGALPVAEVTGQVVLSPLSQDGSQLYDVAVNLGPLLNKTQLLFEKYNHWVSDRHSALLCPLQDDTIRSLQKYIGRFTHSAAPDQLSPGEVDYKVMTVKDPSNKQQMRVYHSVWSFLDLNKFFGDPRQPPLLQHANRLMRSRKGASFRALKQLKEAGDSGAVFPAYSMGADCFDTLMGVEVLTNVEKTRLLIDISTIDLSHSDAQTVVNHYEQSLFSFEDELSREHRVQCALAEAKLCLAQHFQLLDKQLHQTLLPQQEKLSKRNQQALECMETMQKQFLAAYDHCAELHAQTVLQHAMSVLFAQGSVDAPYQLRVPNSSTTATSPIRIPMFLQGEALIVQAAEWMDGTLRKQRQALASLTPSAVRIECRQPEGQHESSEGPLSDQTAMPTFTTATLPRLQTQNAFSGASRLQQLGAEFRDPDRWYYAKRLNTNKPARSMRSYQAYLEANSDARSAPPGRSAAMKGELKGKKVFSGATLCSVLSRTTVTGSDAVSDSSLVSVAPDELFALLDSTTYSNGVAGIDLFSLSSHTVVRLYATCTSGDYGTAGEAPARMTASASALLEQRDALQEELLGQAKALQIELQTRIDPLCDEISATIAEITTLQHTFGNASANSGLPELQEIVRNLSSARAAQDGIDVASITADSFGCDLSEAGGSPVMTKRKGKSSKARRGKQSSRSQEWEAASHQQSLAESSHQSESRGDTPCAFPVTAFFIPADESVPAVRLNSTTVDWQETLAQNLVRVAHDGAQVPDAEHVLQLHRRLCSFGIIYWRHQHQHQATAANQHIEESATTNARITKLLQMLENASADRPASRASPTGDHHHHQHHQHHRAAEIVGNVVVLLRRGVRDLPAIEKLLLAMQEEYAPMKALRLLKEGKERLWRLANHAQFRQLVFGLAYPCLNATENLYGVLKHALPQNDGVNPFPAPVPGVHTMPLFQLRLMLTKFNDLLKCFHAHRRLHSIDPVRHWRSLEFAGLLDYCEVCDKDDILVHFDDKCPNDVSFGDFGRRNSHLRQMVLPVAPEHLLRELQPPALGDVCEADETEAPDANKFYLTNDEYCGSQVMITAGQVVYAMYQLHCYNCSTPMHLCRFPGCSFIRAEAAASWLADNSGESDCASPFLGAMNITAEEASELANVKGSGMHPVDAAIKKYFLTYPEPFTRYPALYLPGHHAPHIPTDHVAGDASDDEVEDAVLEAHVPEGEELSVEEEVVAEQSLDRSVVGRRDTAVKLKLRYRELKEEAALLFALHHAMVRREVTGSVTFKELLMAKGGMYALMEDAAIRKLITKVLVTHTAAANAEYAAYDATAAQELLRLVPSAALLAQLGAGDFADGAFGDDGDKMEEEDGEGDGSAGSPLASSEDSEGSSSSSGSSEGGDGDDFSVSSDGTSVTSTEKLTLQAVVHVKQTHSIPIEILQALSRAEVGLMDPNNDSLGHTFDPYPPLPMVRQGALQQAPPHHHVNPMPTSMYDLLMRRLRLTRADRIASQPNYSVATPSTELINRRSSSAAALIVKEKESHYFRFDRLHHEQVVVLQDGSVVVVQFLHGILQGASLVVIQPKKQKKKTKLSLFANNDVYPNIEVYENVSGAPPAALRFIHTSKLPTVKPGLTVAVFDALSTVSRAFIIEQRSIKRTCEAFGVNENDYTALARKIGSLAHQCIQVTRAGLYCTTVMFSVASLHDEDEYSSPPASPQRGRYDTSDGMSSPTERNYDFVDESNVLMSEPSPVETEHNDPAEPTFRYHTSRTSVQSRFSAIESLLSEEEYQ